MGCGQSAPVAAPYVLAIDPASLARANSVITSPGSPHSDASSPRVAAATGTGTTGGGGASVGSRNFTKADFILRDIIGKGGKSLGVQVGYHKLTQKYYALKIMNLTQAAAEGWEVQPQTEAAVMQEVTEGGVPFIVQYCGQFEDTPNLYVVMTYCPGGELFSRMDGRHFSHDEAVFYAAEVLLALQGLHDKGYLYRDLKPENILLDDEGHVHVCDMGFAVKAQRAHRRIG
jgi:serine/threonine protein kinase